jgi:lipoate-protein ligase A
MKEEWRFIYEPEVEPAAAYAFPASIRDGINKGIAPNTMVLAGFNKHWITMNEHGDINTEVNLEACKRHNVEIVRRIGLGFGTGFMDKDAVMLLEMIFKPDFFMNMDKAHSQVGSAYVQAYLKLGVRSIWYDHIGDLRAGGMRKMTGMGMAIMRGLGFHYGFINIGPIDLDIMLDVIPLVPEKFKDKAIKELKSYTISAEEEAGRHLSKDKIRDVIKEAFENTLQIKLIEGELSDEERKWFEEYKKYAMSDECLYQCSSTRRFAKIPEGCKLGTTKYKARKLIQPFVLIDEADTIRDLMLCGDYMFSPTEYVYDLEEALKGIDAFDKEAIILKIKDAFARSGCEVLMVSPEDFADAIITAAKAAKKD